MVYLFVGNSVLFKADQTDSAGVKASTETGGKVGQVFCSQRWKISYFTLTLVEAEDQKTIVNFELIFATKKLPSGYSDAVWGHGKTRAMP